jgi:hypothetical protein
MSKSHIEQKNEEMFKGKINIAIVNTTKQVYESDQLAELRDPWRAISMVNKRRRAEDDD